jgi:hypothetical protein
VARTRRLSRRMFTKLVSECLAQHRDLGSAAWGCGLASATAASTVRVSEPSHSSIGATPGAMSPDTLTALPTSSETTRPASWPSSARPTPTAVISRERELTARRQPAPRAGGRCAAASGSGGGHGGMAAPVPVRCLAGGRGPKPRWARPSWPGLH